MMTVQFRAKAGLTDPLVQIIRLGPGNSLENIYRSELTSYAKTISMSGVDEVIVVVAGRETTGDFTLIVNEIAAASDVMCTRWNTGEGKEYEVDPRGGSWTWLSPDIMVDNNLDGNADQWVLGGQNNKLRVRLRNKGNRRAENIGIRFWYRETTPILPDSGWLVVENMDGAVQEVTNGILEAGDEKWFTVDWAVPEIGFKAVTVKVELIVPADPNVDNKIAMSNLAFEPK